MTDFIPQQVKDAEARSNALLEQLRTPPAELAAPPATPDVAPAPAATPATPDENDPGYWRQRFSVLRGKYDAEVPIQAAKIRELTAKNAELTARVVELEAKVGSAAQAPAADLSAFDPELVDMTRRVAREAVQEAIKPAQAPAASQQPTDDQAARERFLDALSDLVDDWEVIDRDQAWKMYLSQIEPDTGQPRQHRLTAAVNRHDVVTTASIFQAFKRARAASRPTPDLARQIVPTQAGQSGAPVETARTFTRNDVRKFYSDVNSGKIRDQAEITRIENQINAALREGRILAG